MRHKLWIPFLLLVLAAGVSLTAVPARAQSSAGDLISAVNALRAQNGLPAYQVDAGLMATAQGHSDYQASIGQATHTRADGSSPATLGFIENIMAGYNLSAHSAVNTWMGDYWHLNTMTGISAGYVGAGEAVKDGVVYYTLDVRRAPGSTDIAPRGAGFASTPGPAGSTNSAGSQKVVQVETVTPASDGSVIIVVQPGQSVWSIAIAYNIKVTDLIAINGLPPTPVLYAGQKLIIQPAFTVTPSPTITKTPRPPTRTPTPTWTPRPPTLTPTITPTPTATTFSLETALSLQKIDRRSFGLGLIAICVAGLALVVVGSLRKK